MNFESIGITGGLGFIGTNLIEHIRKDGWKGEIRILDNRTNPSGSLVPDDRMVVLDGDIRDRDAVQHFVQGLDAVVHLAAHTRVMNSIEEPRLNFEINVEGTLNILEAMLETGVNVLINASTGGAILGEAEPPIDEGMPARPISPYGASKLAVEGYCSAFAGSYGIKAVSLRFSNIYGCHSKNKSSVVAAFLKAIRKGGQIVIYGDGSQTRDYLYVDDLVDGIVKAMSSGKDGVYQLGSGRPTSINELIDIIEEVTGVACDRRYENFRDGEILHTHCNIDKARRDLGFEPATSLREGVKRTWEWFLEEV